MAALRENGAQIVVLVLFPDIIGTEQRCREAVWWPKMNTYVEQLVLECEAYIRSGKSVKPVKPPLQPIPWRARPWQYPRIDIAGAFVATPLSHKYMIVVHDLHSKWSEVSCNSSGTSGTISNCSPGGDYQKLSLLTMDPDSHLSSSLNSYAVKVSNIALRLSTILKATVV